MTDDDKGFAIEAVDCRTHEVGYFFTDDNGTAHFSKYAFMAEAFEFGHAVRQRDALRHSNVGRPFSFNLVPLVSTEIRERIMSYA